MNRNLSIATGLITLLIFATVPTPSQSALVAGTLVCVPIVEAGNVNTNAASNCGGGLSTLSGDCMDHDPLTWYVSLGYRTGTGTAKIAVTCGGTLVASCYTYAPNKPCKGEGPAKAGTMECTTYVFEGNPDDFFGGCEDPISHRWVRATLASAPEKLGLTETQATERGIEIETGPITPRADVTQIDVDLTALAQQVRETGRLVLPFPGMPVEVELQYKELRAPGWKAIVFDGNDVGQEVDVGDVGTYRARLPGTIHYANPVTLVPGFISANIEITDCVMMIMENSAEQPATDVGLTRVDVYIDECRSDQSIRTIADVQDLLTQEGGENANDTDGPCPAVGAPSTSSLSASAAAVAAPCAGNVGVPYTDLGLGSLLFGWTKPTTTQVLKVGLGSDTAFNAVSPSTWASRQLSIMNDMDAKIYNSQLTIDLQSAVQFTYSAGSGPSATICGSATTGPIGAFITKWQTDSTLSGVVRDYALNFYEQTMVETSLTVRGCSIREAGINSPTTDAYSVVRTKAVSAPFKYRVGAHELGHILFGEHKLAETWYDAQDRLERGTIMSTGNIEPDNRIDKFSEGDDDTKNSYRVRFCAVNKSSCNTLTNYAG